MMFEGWQNAIVRTRRFPSTAGLRLRALHHSFHRFCGRIDENIAAGWRVMSAVPDKFGVRNEGTGNG